jgi:hypothetical protein
MRKMIVKYMLTTASKEIRGIIATLLIPIMHCPFSILVMRLQPVSTRIGSEGFEHRQNKIEDDHSGVDSQHPEGVENVYLRA